MSGAVAVRTPRLDGAIINIVSRSKSLPMNKDSSTSAVWNNSSSNNCYFLRLSRWPYGRRRSGNKSNSDKKPRKPTLSPAASTRREGRRWQRYTATRPLKESLPSSKTLAKDRNQKASATFIAALSIGAVRAKQFT